MLSTRTPARPCGPFMPRGRGAVHRSRLSSSSRPAAQHPLAGLRAPGYVCKRAVACFALPRSACAKPLYGILRAAPMRTVVTACHVRQFRRVRDVPRSSSAVASLVYANYIRASRRRLVNTTQPPCDRSSPPPRYSSSRGGRIYRQSYYSTLPLTNI